MWQQIFPLSMFAASATNIRYDCMVLQNSDRDLISYDIQEMVQVTWWRAPMGNTTLSDRDSNLWFTFNAWLDKRWPSSNYGAHCMSHNHLHTCIHRGTLWRKDLEWTVYYPFNKDVWGCALAQTCETHDPSIAPLIIGPLSETYSDPSSDTPVTDELC